MVAMETSTKGTSKEDELIITELIAVIWLIKVMEGNISRTCKANNEVELYD